MTICICCSNVAYLTPVQEALLSFLFPFNWQGCYIPILPTSMLEILDAPVPFLVGIQDEYLLTVSPEKHMQSVVFAHLDTDTIYYRGETLCHGKTTVNPTTNGEMIWGQNLPMDIPRIPKSAGKKLRDRLIEFGSCVHRLNVGDMNPQYLTASFELAGSIYPNNEYLTPIDSFISEGGVKASKQSTKGRNHSKIGASHTTHTVHNSAAKRSHPSFFLMRKNDSEKDTQNTSWNTACTWIESSSAVNNAYEQSCIFNPKNNYASVDCTTIPTPMSSSSSHRSHSIENDYSSRSSIGGSSMSISSSGTDSQRITNHLFSASDIRGAYLRFFVALMIDCHDFYAPSDGAASPSSMSSQQATFRKDAFKEHLKGKEKECFEVCLIDSQMFSNFADELCQAPPQKEIQLFNEHIIAKKNRSRLRKRQETPFLDDASDAVSETFIVPTPSTQRLPSSQDGYSYPDVFPVLDPSLCDKPRVPPELVQETDIKAFIPRAAGVLSAKHLSLLGSDFRSFSSMNFSELSAKRRKGSQPLIGSNSEHGSGSGKVGLFRLHDQDYSGFAIADGHLNMMLKEAEIQFKAASRTVVAMQSKWRMWSVYRKFNEQIKSRAIRSDSAVKIQRLWNLVCKRVRHRRFLHAVVRLQCLLRGMQKRSRYQATVRKIIRLQAQLRGYLSRFKQNAHKISLFNAYRQQVLSLWYLDRTNVIYCSHFWCMLSTPSYLTIALYAQELSKLYREMNLLASSDNIAMRERKGTDSWQSDSNQMFDPKSTPLQIGIRSLTKAPVSIKMTKASNTPSFSKCFKYVQSLEVVQEMLKLSQSFSTTTNDTTSNNGGGRQEFLPGAQQAAQLAQLRRDYDAQFRQHVDAMPTAMTSSRAASPERDTAHRHEIYSALRRLQQRGSNGVELAPDGRHSVQKKLFSSIKQMGRGKAPAESAMLFASMDINGKKRKTQLADSVWTALHPVHVELSSRIVVCLFSLTAHLDQHGYGLPCQSVHRPWLNEFLSKVQGGHILSLDVSPQSSSVSTPNSSRLSWPLSGTLSFLDINSTDKGNEGRIAVSTRALEIEMKVERRIAESCGSAVKACFRTLAHTGN